MPILAACSSGSAPGGGIAAGPDATLVFDASVSSDAKLPDSSGKDQTSGKDAGADAGSDAQDAQQALDAQVVDAQDVADVQLVDTNPDTQLDALPDATPDAAGTCATPADCDDGVACTTDSCQAGTCKHAPGLGCCSSDAQCASSEACWQGQCSQGTCAQAPIAGCCSAGTCCDQAKHIVLAAKTACGTMPVAIQYQCAGTAVQQRTAIAGCDGVTADGCSTDVALATWTPWLEVAVCENGESCVPPTGSAKVPTCSGGSATGCLDDAACEDGNDCTADTCVAGKCQQTPANTKTTCGSGSVATEYKCSDANAGGDVQSRKAWAACDGAGACSASLKIWGPWATIKACNWSEVCSVPEPSIAGTCKPAPDCAPGTTCCTGDGAYAPAATACGKTTAATEYKCDGGKGGAVLVRKAVAGCSGWDTYCFSGTSTLAWGEWSTFAQCTANQACEASWSTSQPGTCKSQCTANSTCCDADGVYAAKGSQCNSYSSSTQYQCEGAGKGAAISQRKGYDGCTGSSTSCSWNDADTFWGAWTPYKTCAANQKCALSSGGSYASCQDAGVCSPTGSCCTPAGDYLAQGTKCGTWALDTEYKCSDTGKGATVLKREGYSGCDAAGYCSSSASNEAWGEWTSYKTCSSTQYCKVSTYSGTCSTTP